MRTLLMTVMSGVATCALAQAPASKPVFKPTPVEERSPGQAPSQLLQQQRITAAYRDMQQAAYEAKLAEQDVLNTQDAFNAARLRADSLKQELDQAIKARDAAKAKENALRKRYDEALSL